MEWWTNKSPGCKTQIYAYEGHGALKMDKNTMWRTKEIIDKEKTVVKLLKALVNTFYRKGGNQKSIFIFFAAIVVFLCYHHRTEKQYFKTSFEPENLKIKSRNDLQRNSYLQNSDGKEGDNVFLSREIIRKNEEPKDTYYENERKDVNVDSDLIELKNWNGTITPVLTIKKKTFKKLQFQTRIKNKISLKLEAKRAKKGLKPYEVWDDQGVSNDGDTFHVL